MPVLILNVCFSSLTTLSHSLDDISSSWSQSQLPNDHVLTIEELRLQLSSCFTCGVSWAEHHVSLDCSECGGYAMERPCAKCDGRCNEVLKRDLTMSHASGKARWVGECQLNTPAAMVPKGGCAPRTTSETGALAQELCARLEKLSATS